MDFRESNRALGLDLVFIFWTDLHINSSFLTT